MPVRWFTNWAMKPHIGSEVDLLNSDLPVRNEMMWCIYKIIYIWTAIVDESEEWSSQYIFQFKQLERRSLKKIRASTGFEPVTSVMPVRWFTNWAMKPHIGSEVDLLNSDLPVRNEMMWCIYKIIYIWTAIVDESEEWSSQYIFQFKQLERRSLKKIRASTGFEPVTSPIPVRCSTNWAMKPHIGSEVNLLSSYLPMRNEQLCHLQLQFIYEIFCIHVYITSAMLIVASGRSKAVSVFSL